MNLTDDQLDRYSRQIILPGIGGAGQAKLLAAHVVMIGAGGIGCPALAYLAAAGVGRITIVDDDTVDLANLQRQILFGTDDIGKSKADAAARALGRMNPDCNIIAVKERFTAQHENVDYWRDADVVIDGTDNFATRLAVSDAATRARVPLVSAALGRFQGQLATFYGWQADQPCYRCFVGDAFDADDCDTCAEQGVLGAVVGVMGTMAASEAIRVITGFGEDQAGKLHLFDGLAPAWRTMRIAKDPGCRTCGGQSATPRDN